MLVSQTSLVIAKKNAACRKIASPIKLLLEIVFEHNLLQTTKGNQAH